MKENFAPNARNQTISNGSESRKPLSPAEISFLEEKKSWAILLLLAVVAAIPLSYAFFYWQLDDWVQRIALMTAITIVYSIPFYIELNKIARLNRDVSGGYKSIFTAQIDDFKQKDYKSESGAHTSSDYFLFLRGEKYQVKGEDFFKFGKGDLVKVEAASQSKYVFKVERVENI